MPTGIYKRSEAIKANMRIKMKGNTSHLGFKNSEESKRKMSLAALGKHDNEKNPAWKGDEAGYTALHNWVRRRLGKASKCVNGHIAKQYYWANISGEYKRDLSDWHEFCCSCNHLDGIRIHERFLSI